MKIKLCGFTEEKSLQLATTLKIDFIGFVFHEKSPRNIELDKAKTLGDIIPQNIAKVAVTVNASIEKLQKIAQSLKPQYFQLHGEEPITKITEIKKHFPEIKIIKALALQNNSDLEKVAKYSKIADILLFDNKVAGSGETFDWKILQNLELEKDWFLSGGLNIENIENAIKTTGAKMIDISSGIEKIRGQKSPELIKKFIEKLK